MLKRRHKAVDADSAGAVDPCSGFFVNQRPQAQVAGAAACRNMDAQSKRDAIAEEVRNLEG